MLVVDLKRLEWAILLKGAVVLRRGLLGSSTIVHRCREILLEDAGDRGLAASDLGSNTLLTNALGSEGKDYFFRSREHCLSAITARYFYAFMSFNNVYTNFGNDYSQVLERHSLTS